MIGKLYAVHDELSNEYGIPFFTKNDQTAWRHYNKIKSQMKSGYNDTKQAREVDLYNSLYRLGDFDTETGVVVPDLKEVESQYEIDADYTDRILKRME